MITCLLHKPILNGLHILTRFIRDHAYPTSNSNIDSSLSICFALHRLVIPVLTADNLNRIQASSKPAMRIQQFLVLHITSGVSAHGNLTNN